MESFKPLKHQGIPDFLVLAGKVRKSLAIDWQVGMKVKVYFVDEAKYYSGKY